MPRTIPYAQIAFTQRIRTSPFFESTIAAGCSAFTVYNHMYMPAWYSDPVTDYWALKHHVTLWDVSAQRQVEITGPDAARFAQYLTSRDLRKTKIGQCRYVPIVDAAGGILNDPVMLKLAEDRFWLSLADSDILLWAKGLASAHGFDVCLFEPDVSPLQLQGPKSANMLSHLFGDHVAALRFFRFLEVEKNGIPLVISRTGWSKEDGFEIYLQDSRQGTALWDMLMDAGADFGIKPACPSQISRLEAGMLSYGGDMDCEANPFELGWDKFVYLGDEIDYVAKPALRRIKAQGITRKLVSVEISGPALTHYNGDGAKAWSGDEIIGKVTSSVYSPSLDKNIGLAMVRLDHTMPGSTFDVVSNHLARQAIVCKLPFVKAQKPTSTLTPTLAPKMLTPYLPS